MEAGDGSGLFRFPESRDGDVYTTAGLYYFLGDEPEGAPLSYPPPSDWTEIGEIALDDVSEVAFTLGTERLILAESRKFPHWHHRLAELIEHIDEVADPGSLPPAREALDKF